MRIASLIVAAVMFTATPAMASGNAFVDFFRNDVPEFFTEDVREVTLTTTGKTAKYADNGYRVARQFVTGQAVVVRDAVLNSVAKAKVTLHWLTDGADNPFLW